MNACKKVRRLSHSVLIGPILFAWCSSLSNAGESPVQNTLEVRHISVSIGRSPDEVYRFASKLENWSQWASGLGKATRKAGGDWIVDGPLGEVKVRVAEENAFRVLDHDVTLPSGVTVHNPFRVLPNGAGSEVVFSVFRQPGTPDAEFQKDTKAVETDLRALKQVLERY
jgi:hypothetical protein